MQIYIGRDTTVSDIQQQFHTDYPRLRLVFSRKPHAKGEKYDPDEAPSPDTTVEALTPFRSPGWLDVSYFRTAAAVEHDLRHHYGLYAQVFRKSGGQWLQTTGTDNWSLEELNAKGQAAEPQPFAWPDEPIDE
ncbi:hypothetical protein [Chitinophaga vietnamensis]|uniref:hypothetical protein n=1 Tax=Chitinophaga vietnamensis TaxID=2593957 RepID=UPI0011780EA3|nr:hypothetical protein [Chitinophaga vietnamensis]